VGVEKIDLKLKFKELYTSKSGTFTKVMVPTLHFLMVDGSGDPNTSKEYASAIETLYTLSYTLKFMSKEELGRDYTVPPLEGLWWSNDMKDFESGNKGGWLWTAMIMLPDWIAPSLFEEGLDSVAKRKPAVDLTRVRREALTEGLSVQTLFIGPYSDEGPVISQLHNSYLPAHGLKESGKHHEIYLSDPRRTTPNKLRTIIRQPVSKK
jgi:hypothetical protein